MGLATVRKSGGNAVKKGLLLYMKLASDTYDNAAKTTRPITGTGYQYQPGGKFGDAIYFGNNACIVVPNFGTLNEFTFSCFLKKIPVSAFDTVFSSRPSMGHASLNIILAVSNNFFQFYAGETSLISKAECIDGNWHHVTVRGTGTKDEVFIDGIKSVEMTNHPAIMTGITIIGADAYNISNRGWNGSVCEFAIWDRALSDDEIAWLYNSGNGHQIAVI
jgi:hypothetical protein